MQNMIIGMWFICKGATIEITSQHIIHGAMTAMRLLEIGLNQGQIALQGRQISVAHYLLQGIDVHPRPQTPQGAGAAETVGTAGIQQLLHIPRCFWWNHNR